MDRGRLPMALRLITLAAVSHASAVEALGLTCGVTGASYTDPSVLQENGGLPDDAVACQETCAKTAGCVVFTFYTDSKGCWLMTSLAKIRTPKVPSDQFAISGPRVCREVPTAPPTAKATSDLDEDAPAVTEAKSSDEDEAEAETTPSTTKPSKGLTITDEGLVTVAPGIEISPTGVRPIGLGAAPPDAEASRPPERTADQVKAFGYTVQVNATKWGLPEEVFGVREIAGYSWVWYALATIVLLLLGCTLYCCCCPKTRMRRKRAASMTRDMVPSEQTEVLSREVTEVQEQVPLVIKDAGLMQPRLNVPQLPMPQLQIPQLVAVPASQANARSFELSAHSPGGHWSPGQGQFVRVPMSPSRYP